MRPHFATFNDLVTHVKDDCPVPPPAHVVQCDRCSVGLFSLAEFGAHMIENDLAVTPLPPGFGDETMPKS